LILKEKNPRMKNFYLLLFFSFLAVNATAQEDSTSYDEIDEYEFEDEEDSPITIFSRLSLSMFTLTANPAELEVAFWDDDFIDTDSIYGVSNTDKLWTYGINFGFGFLMKDTWMLNIDNHLGWGAGGRLFNYNLHIGIGREFRFNQFFIQPIFSLGYIGTNFKMGEYPPSTKDYFVVNDQYIYDNLTVRLKGRAFTLSPALFVEYQLSREISIFGKATINYSFWDTHFVTVGGKTDEIDEDGDAITATERIRFDDSRLIFNVNNQKIIGSESPYLHYNLNGVQFQVGLSFGVSWYDAEDVLEEY